MAKSNIKKKIEETLKDFKVLSVRYMEVKDNEELMDMFLSRNRNPIFDLSSNKMFRTGLVSNEVKKMTTKGIKGKADDHFIQRKMSMRYIFEYIVSHPDIGYDDFARLLVKYNSTVRLTKEEHDRVTDYAKGKGMFNFELYEQCGIIVEGLSDFIPAELL
jgi:hypothetical protein